MLSVGPLRTPWVANTSSKQFDRIMMSAENRDRIWHDREEAKDVFLAGARVYICGSAALARGVKEICTRIYAEHKGCEGEVAEKWMRGVEAERFATDVFA